MLTRQLKIFKEIIFLLVQKDLRVKYRGSFLGYLWSVMSPLLQMTVLAFVFSHLMRFEVEYFPLFLLSGILVWNFIHQSITTGTHSIVNNAGLVRRVKLSASVFPIACIGTSFITFYFSLIPFLLISLYLGKEIQFHILLLPVLFLPLIGFVAGVALFLASINVRFRDVGHILDPVLSLFFYGTPIIYPLEVLPPHYQSLLMFNPFVHFVVPIRAVMFENRWPMTMEVVFMLAISSFALLIGIFTYRRLKNEFIFYL
jgi:lipopolysaccharide transport system permease protein